MKQLYLSLILISVIFLPASFAVNIESNLKKEEKPSITFKQETFTVEEFKSLTPEKFKKKIGKKLSLKDRILLKFLKKKMDKNGKLEINWGAAVLGLFLGIIGLVITLFFKDKKAWKSALIGIGVGIVISLLVVALI